MNDPVIDNLFSTAGPRPDVGPASGGRRSDDPNEFGDRLRQAAAPAADQSAEPWWHSAPDRRDLDQRSSDFSQQPPPPPPLSNRDPERTADQAPAVQSNSFDENAAAAKSNDDKPIEQNSDPTSTAASVAATTSQTSAKLAHQKPADDKQTSKESPHGSKDAADRTAQAKTDASVPAMQNDSVSAVVQKSAAAVKGTVATQQTPTADAQQSATKEDKKPAAATGDENPQSADTTPSKPADTVVAAQQTVPSAPATPVVAVVAAAASAAAGNSDPAVAPRPDKVTADHAASKQKLAAQADTPTSQSSSKRSAASQSTSAKAKTGDASTETAAATSTVKGGDQPDAKKKASVSNEVKSTADRPDPAAASGGPNTNQSTPNVAAVTTTTIADTAVKDVTTEPDAKIAKDVAAPKSSPLAAFGRLDRGSPFAARGPQQSGDNSDGPPVDPARFVSRVARAIETAQDRGAPINLRLSPPELGAMRLELSVKQGVMTAKVETETAAARQALLDNLPTLRDRLAEQNIRIDRFDVNVRRDPSGDQANAGPQQRQFQQQQQFYQAQSTRSAVGPTHGAEGAAADLTPTIRTITDTTINLVA
jgi:flagellar hook-length control protein FliK